MPPDSVASLPLSAPTAPPAVVLTAPAPAASAFILRGPVPRIDRWVAVQILGLFFASRLLIYTVSALSHTTLYPGTFETNGKTWIERFLVWDSGWYMGIVRGGYFYKPDRASSVAFYPLYPMIIRFFMKLGFDGNIAGFAVSLASLLGACFLIWRLAAHETRSSAIAWRTVVFLLFAPGAVWFGMVYTESFYLLTVLGCLLCARRGQWVRAGLWGFASALTRTPGLFLAGFIFIEAVQQWWEERQARMAGFVPPPVDPALPAWQRVPWIARSVIGALGPIIGHLSYLIFLQIEFGDWRAQQKTMAAGWGGHMQMPWNALFEQWNKNDPVQMLISTPFLGIVLILAGVGLWTLKRVGYAVFVWALAILYVSATPGDSVTRYLCTSAPVFIVAAQLSEKSKLLETTILVFSTGIMVLITILLANGYRMI